MRRRHLPGWTQFVLAAAGLAVTAFIVWPQLPEGHRALDVVRRLSVPLAGCGFLLEAASLAVNSMTTRLLVGPGRLPYSTLIRIDLTALGLNHAVPAGAATSAAVRVRLQIAAGLPARDAVAAATVEATAADLVLGGVFLLGVGLAAVVGVATASYLTVSVFVLTFFIATAVLGRLLLGGEAVLQRWLAVLARRLPRMPVAALARTLDSLGVRIRDLVDHPSRTGAVLVWAALNWLFDAAALWVMLAAAGVRLGPGPLLIVYGLGNLIAILPVTPGGLGIVEGVMIPALIGFDVPRPVAFVGIIGWRLWQFWMPLPLGALAYASLRLGPLRRVRAARLRSGSGGPHTG